MWWPASCSCLLLLLLLLLQLPDTNAENQNQLNITKKERKMAISTWKAFLQVPNSGVDLVLDSIKSYPDADRVLNSLSRETGLPVDKLHEALEPLGTNLLINYTKIFALLKSDSKLNKYMKRMHEFYKDKRVTEDEYTTLNGLISKHIHSKLASKYSKEEMDSVGNVLEAIKTGIFNDS